MMQQGFALLLVLCAILFMSAIVSITYRDLHGIYYIVENNKNKQFEKQVLLASESFFLEAFNQLIAKGMNFNNISLELLILSDVIKVNDVEVNYRLIDSTNCFNLNAVNGNGTIYPWIVFWYILRLNNVTSKKFNERMIDFRFYSKFGFENDYIDSIKDYLVPGEEDILAISYLSDYIIKLSGDDLFKITPFICHRNDGVLLININMLEPKHGKLLQAIFINIISEDNIAKIISSKPDEGWASVESFFEFITENTTIDNDKLDGFKNNLTLKFSHDKYYFSSIFKLYQDKGNYQLMSTFYVNDKGATVVRRRFSFSE